MGLFGFGKPKKNDEHRSLLTTVHDNVELSIVQSILEGENIPYAYSERGSGGVVRVISGYSMYGTDIYVPTAVLDTARELLEAYRSGVAVEEEETDPMEHATDEEVEAFFSGADLGFEQMAELDLEFLSEASAEPNTDGKSKPTEKATAEEVEAFFSGADLDMVFLQKPDVEESADRKETDGE